ncbi:MAG: DNA polymerase III subunit delta [Ruminococcaceae bacterium]|nr:DNA polymerase III subunit delta [Oscillospiraceae bacterium]
MSYQTLKEQLKTGQLSPCFHFFGEEQYLKNHYIGLLKNAVVDGAMETFNYTVFEGSVSPDTLITALQTPPMMAEKKLVLLKDTGIFTPGAAGKDQLQAMFADWPSYAYLVAAEDKFDKRSAVYKAFLKIGLSVEFAYRTRADLRVWVLKILKQNGKTMKADTLEVFIDAAGVDMHGILGNLEKLIAFTADRSEIKKEDVEALLVRSFMTKEYMLTDALLAKNQEGAFAALSALWEMQTDPIRILTVIASNFLSVAHARALLDDKVPYPAIVDALHLPSAFLAKKAVETAGKTDSRRLDRAIHAIKETDYKMKLGMVEPKTGITLLCAELLK